jgi:archaemetzincin
MKKYFWEELNFMFRYFFFPVLVFLIFSSCKSKNDANFFDNDNIIIDLQPFDGITAAQTRYIFNEFKKIYTFIEIKKSIPVPQSAYYPSRNRFRADSIIEILNRQAPTGHKIIGLISKDISTTKNDIADWGVMGLGFCPGKACIASTFRLSKEETDKQLFKVAIHEMGHTFGLPHCPIKSCFMRDAEGGNPTNEEKGFCAKCKSYLSSKGWCLK